MLRILYSAPLRYAEYVAPLRSARRTLLHTSLTTFATQHLSVGVQKGILKGKQAKLAAPLKGRQRIRFMVKRP